MKKSLLICLLLLLGLSNYAQEFSVDNVSRLSLNSLGTISDSNGLAGYYYFYKYEKISGKENAYVLSVLDNNLNSIKNIKINRSKKDILIECAYNGTHFLFSFYDQKRIELVTYNAIGKSCGKKTYANLSRMEKARLLQYISNEEGMNLSTFTIGNKGFLRLDVYANKGEKYTLDALDSNLKTMWTFKSDVKGKMYEIPTVVSSSSNYILLNVLRRKGALSKDMSQVLVLVDAQTGKKIVEIDPKKNREVFSIINCFLDEEKQEIVSIGEFFKPNDMIIGSKSLGLYAAKYDFTGKELLKNKMTWGGEISKFQKTKDNGKMKDGGFTYFHKIHKAVNGNYVIIGEQYKKIVSSSGVILRILGFDAGLADFKIMDMVVMELSSDFKLKKYDLIEKNDRILSLPKGYEFIPANSLAPLFKSIGGFDYEFSNEDKQRGRFFSSYINFLTRKESENNKKTAYVGTIIYDDGFQFDKLPLTTDATTSRLLPGRPGYISIFEYYKKKKKFIVRLEKINY